MNKGGLGGEAPRKNFAKDTPPSKRPWEKPKDTPLLKRHFVFEGGGILSEEGW